jgi:predicted N-acetyltransferase YhbS
MGAITPAATLHLMLLTELVIRMGTQEDAQEITGLVNRAYAGVGGGWTNERGLVEGPRTSFETVADLMRRGTFLVGQERGARPLLASVYVERRDAHALYLGMLSVEPAMQARGLGRTMVQACEKFARNQGVFRLALTVLCGRDTLHGWYERRGFRSTGKRVPLVHGKGLELLTYEKELGVA